MIFTRSVFFTVIIFCNSIHLVAQTTTHIVEKNALVELNRALSEILIYDKFSPPVASRIFAYSNLSACTMAAAFSKVNPPAIAFPIVADSNPATDDAKVIYSCLKTYSFVARELVYSQATWEQQSNTCIQKWLTKNSIDMATLEKADSLAKQEAKRLLAWAAQDGYPKRLSLKKYEVQYEVDSAWKPTAPSFILPIEPYWSTIRPFYYNEPDSFLPQRHFAFSKEKGTPFYSMVEAVYKQSKKLNAKQHCIAAFWDCNPIKSKNYGHVMVFNFRLTPAAHWVLLTADIIESQHWDFFKTTKFYSELSLTMADAFILCWQSKYDNNWIRPETYINNYIDKEWQPELETPPFPEYPSGHSFVSAAAAEICSYYLGDKFAFTDSVQSPFRIPTRQFKSFRAAAIDAGISRFYGGIHYRESVMDGIDAGKKLGAYVVKNKVK